MAEPTATKRMRFPRWANFVLPTVLVLGALGAPYKLLLIGLVGSPTTLNVGYQPHQPIPYSHELHVNQLGIDCRYCHNTIEKAAYAAIPPTSVCINCHHGVRTDSEKLRPLYKSFSTGEPVGWLKVHDLADYSYFNHSAHINKGVSCWSCHGRVDRMGEEGVWQVKELAMGWCLKCHRDPAPNIRPKNQVFNLMWGYAMTEAELAELRGMKVGADDIADYRAVEIVGPDRYEALDEAARLAAVADYVERTNQAYQARVDEIGKRLASADVPEHERGRLTEGERRAIGDLLVLRYQIRTPKRMADCSQCHR